MCLRVPLPSQGERSATEMRDVRRGVLLRDERMTSDFEGADNHIRAAVADGRTVSETDMWKRFGVRPETVQKLVDMALEKREPPYKPAARRGKEPQSERAGRDKARGDAAAKALPRRSGR
jgi:hypothetical protein